MGALDNLGRHVVTVQNLRLEAALHDGPSFLIIDAEAQVSVEALPSVTAIDVIGGGPAGAMAAIAARHDGADVRVFEKSGFPRHKVCGEFLSPDILMLLRRAGCETEFLALRPAAIRTMHLHFGSRLVRHALPQPAYGLSRYALDRLLLDRAAALGAEVVRETRTPRAVHRPLVLANGRTAQGRAGERLFGFKAHYRGGTADDTVALFFFDGCYVGVSAVENAEINVCGLAPERLLRDCAFEPDRLLERCQPLQQRMQGLDRVFEWLTTGPLVPGLPPRKAPEPLTYPAGDALGFIDPFTGSGILNAMLCGYSAGGAAARSLPVDAYLAAGRRAFRRPFLVSALFRKAIGTGLAGPLAAFVPGSWLFHLTRPGRSWARD
jgi:hypothetical protein